MKSGGRRSDIRATPLAADQRTMVSCIIKLDFGAKARCSNESSGPYPVDPEIVAPEQPPQSLEPRHHFEAPIQFH